MLGIHTERSSEDGFVWFLETVVNLPVLKPSEAEARMSLTQVDLSVIRFHLGSTPCKRPERPIEVVGRGIWGGKCADNWL